MLTNAILREVIHQPNLSRTDILLLCLAVGADNPKQIKEIKSLAIHAGVLEAKKWNISIILSRTEGWAIRIKEGWVLSRDGKAYVSEIAKGFIDPVNPQSVSSSVDKTPTGKKIFIGHGRSQAWKDLRELLEYRLHLDWDEFNREPTAGITTVNRLEDMLTKASFAFLVMTAEDEHTDGSLHARENVIHEAGLFQGKLGFKKAILLLEDGCKTFSNVHGLTYIPFPAGNIKAISEEIRRVLEREGILRK